MAIQITRKLSSPVQLLAAAEIFYEAFRLKIYYLELFPRSREQAIRVLLNSFCPENAFFALEDEQVLGLVGLDWPGRRFQDFSWRLLTAEFGTWGALWRKAWILINQAFARPRRDEVRIAAIAVSSAARGRGVGSQLLEQVFGEARQAGCRAVVLEVVDSNPRARKLYEQIGFQVTHSEWTGPVTARAGFTGFTHMRKLLEPNAPGEPGR